MRAVNKKPAEFKSNLLCKDAPERFSGLVLMNSGLPTGFSAEEVIRSRPLDVVRGNLPFFILRATVALFGTGLPIVSKNEIKYFYSKARIPLNISKMAHNTEDTLFFYVRVGRGINSQHF